MNKKLAHIFFFIFDFLSLIGLWYGYHEFQRILMEINQSAEVIKFSNREGFCILGIGIPMIHSLALADRMWPSLPKKYSGWVNMGLVITVIALFAAGIIGSKWITSQVEKAGYMYCREASGISALSRTVYYTKDTATCDAIVEAKYKDRQ